MNRSTVSRVRPRFFAYSLARASPGNTPAKYFATLRFRSYSGCVLPVLSGVLEASRGTSSPSRPASSSMASGKESLSYSMRKPSAVPCAPQPKQ